MLETLSKQATHDPLTGLFNRRYLDQILYGEIAHALQSGALVGILMRVLWLGAPRWLYVALYVALGWTAVAVLPAMVAGGGTLVVGLVVAGGIVYTLGALVYARKWPDPSPTWFGFHEIFHVCTVVGWLLHWLAALLAVLAH